MMFWDNVKRLMKDNHIQQKDNFGAEITIEILVKSLQYSTHRRFSRLLFQLPPASHK